MTKLWSVVFLLLSACVGIPEGLKAVDGFEVSRYLGTWYEIARLDHRFERGLENVSAIYSLADGGGLAVLNQGRDTKTGVWKKALGKAYFVEGPHQGRLKVSFFGPFYGAYNIIALDKVGYSYALVAGSDRTSLWILARSKELPQETLDRLVGQAKALGFNTEALLYTQHP